MTTKQYRAVNGQVIEYSPTTKVAAFLARIEEMVADPKVKEQQIVGLAYSSENPFLDHTMFPGRGAVTKEVLGDPAYHVMADLLFRKRLAESGVATEKLAAKYTMGIPEAARELGINENAVRKAIASGRLPSWTKEDGRQYLDPRTFKSIEVGTRGPKKGTFKARTEETAGAGIADAVRLRDEGLEDAVAHVNGEPEAEPLDVIMGQEKGAGLKISVEAEDVQRIADNRLHGRIKRWKRLAVMTKGEGGKRHVYVIVPGRKENAITIGPFAVRGRFDIDEKVTAPTRVDDAWKAAKA